MLQLVLAVLDLQPLMDQLKAHIDQLRDDARAFANSHPRLIRSLLIGNGILTVLAISAAIWLYNDLQRGLPDREAIARIGQMDQATAVYDSHDRLVFTIFKQQRMDTPLSAVSPHLIDAVLAIEDQRFYDHGGLDASRIVAAAIANVRRHRAAQGGSTITQQLARQTFLTPDKTIRRKLQELILSFRIEAAFSKDEILQLYLNKVYFGDGLYGVEAASQGYFGKRAADLTLPEAALLAGLVKSPSRYAPTVNLERAVTRRNLVLQAMLDNKAIDHDTWRQAHETKVVLNDTLRGDEPHGQYFKEEVRQQLVERFGWERVYQGGLRVYTTIDMPMQIAAETAAAASLEALDARRQKIEARRAAANKRAPRPDQNPLQAALVAMEPSTGEVRAMVGGRDFGASHFNRAVQAHRQPGSAFKPFVYAAALEVGYTPATVISHLNDPVDTLQGAYTPADGHSTGDSMTLRTGLRTSSNRAAVRLLQEIGISRAVEYAKTMGVGDVPSVPSLALGSGEVTLASMTAAYAAFANQGRAPKPVLIRRVEDRGGAVLYRANELSVRAISETTAFLMANMLADVVNAGTAAGARTLGFKLPAGGKTGTTNDFNDAWFIGFTPKIVTGVWVGFDQPQTILPNGFAADVAIPFWSQFMKAATANDKPEWFRTPYGVSSARVCRISGKLASEECEHVEVVGKNGDIQTQSMVYTEYFPRGAEPTDYCDVHSALTGHGVLAGASPSPQPPSGDVPRIPPLVGTSGVLIPSGSATPTSSPVAPAALGRSGETTATDPIPPTPDPPKKAGFWSRVFGRGGNDKSKLQ